MQDRGGTPLILSFLGAGTYARATYHWGNHAFEIRNTTVKPMHWERCTQVLNAVDVQTLLKRGWTERPDAASTSKTSSA